MGEEKVENKAGVLVSRPQLLYNTLNSYLNLRGEFLTMTWDTSARDTSEVTFSSIRKLVCPSSRETAISGSIRAVLDISHITVGEFVLEACLTHSSVNCCRCRKKKIKYNLTK